MFMALPMNGLLVIVMGYLNFTRSVSGIEGSVPCDHTFRSGNRALDNDPLW